MTHDEFLSLHAAVSAKLYKREKLLLLEELRKFLTDKQIEGLFVNLVYEPGDPLGVCLPDKRI